VGGRSAQSGGSSGSAGQCCSAIKIYPPPEGTRIPSTCIPHLSKQAVASRHGAFDGVSQHPQGLDFAGAIIFSQSLMAPAASSSWEDAIACADRISWSAMWTAARADMSGVNVRDTANKTVRMARKRRREWVLLEASRACTSYMNVYVAHMMADCEEDCQQVFESVTLRQPIVCEVQRRRHGLLMALLRQRGDRFSRVVM